MTFVIKKAKIPAWGYEITAKGFHNIAPNEHYEAKEQLRHILGERETEMLYQLTTTERRYMEWN